MENAGGLKYVTAIASASRPPKRGAANGGGAIDPAMQARKKAGSFEPAFDLARLLLAGDREDQP